MTTTETIYDTDDVLAAHFANRTRQLAQTEGDTPRKLIWSFIDSGIKEEDDRQFAEDWAKFQRGEQILSAGYHVTYSDSHVQMLDSHAAQIEARNPVSPLVHVTSDYIGTTQRYCYMALIKNR